MTWSMGRTRWRSTWTRSSRGSAWSSSTTCWRLVGTMQATVQLVRQLGGEIAGLGFAIELDFLKGREKFQGYDVLSLLHYDE